MPTREQTLDLLASVIADKYEVLQWIGGGGMADVFLARHRRHGGLFAVKVLADYLAHDRTIVERFLQEARTAATLSGHPNIVSIVDIDEKQGLHYLIMQYVEGEDLTSYLQRAGHLAPAEAVQVITQVAEALVLAHSKGIIHRDLKPANIRLDRYGRVIVLDFGIAKASDVPTALTSMGERLGTPFYMSPEQIRGEPCDQRSDLYSLGVVFFELLTGKKPFEAENYHALGYAHEFTPAPSPSQLDPTIEPDYCYIVLRLLEKDTADRYQTAADLLQHLKGLPAGDGAGSLRPVVSHHFEAQPESTRSPLRVTEPKEAGAVASVETAPVVAPKAPATTPASAVAPAPPMLRAAAPVEVSPPTAAATEGMDSSWVGRDWEPAPAGAAVPAQAPPLPQPVPRKTWPLLAAGAAAVVIAGVGLAVFLGRGSTKSQTAEEAQPKATAEAVKLPERLDTRTGTMYLVPAGNFTFGDASKESPNPPSSVFLPDFHVDSTEVSNGAYKKFCDATGHAYPEPPAWDANYFPGKPDHPVVNVTQNEARSFADWAGKRLPSEQEWEKAARGTDGRVYPWGNAPPQRQANLGGAADGFEHSAPVDAFPEGAGPYGARNMAGNVWEWTGSAYAATEREVADMQKALGSPVSSQWAVIKGGSFAPETNELWLRAYMRRALPVTGKSPYIGFRCVQDAKR